MFIGLVIALPEVLLSNTLSVKTHHSVNVAGGRMAVTAVTENNGDETLHNLQLFLTLYGETEKSLVRPVLENGGQNRVEFEQSLAGYKPGEYPVIVQAVYTNKHMVPGSAFSCSTVSVPGGRNSDITVSCDRETTISYSGIVDVVLKDIGTVEKTVKLTVLPPKPFSVEADTVSITTTPGEQTVVPVALFNRYANAGDRHTVFFVVEYDLNGVHATEITDTRVTVVESVNIFRKYRGVWWGMSVFAGVGFVVSLIMDLRKSTLSIPMPGGSDVPNKGNILLINPDWQATRRRQPLIKRAWQPLDLANTGAILEEHGFGVRIIDNAIEAIPPEMLGKIAAGYDKVFLTSAAYDRWQCPPVDITRFIITAENIPGEKLYVFGPHVTERTEALLKRTGARAAIIGEPEYTILDIVLKDRGDSFPDDIDGAAWLNDFSLKKAPSRKPVDLKDLPPPAFHLIDMKAYSYELMGRGFTIMEASRGCSYGCGFCYKHMYGPGYRQKDHIQVVNEIIRVNEAFGVSNVYFMDLEFGQDRSWLTSFCNELINRNVSINWCCQTRVTDVDSDIIRLMKRSGCSLIHFGIESGSPSILAKTGKGIAHDTCVNAITLAKEHGIRTAVFFSFGFSEETEDDMRQTIAFSIKLKPTYASFNRLIPYPGTRVGMESGIDYGAFPVEQYPQYAFPWHSESLLRRMVRNAWLKFYLRPSYLAGLLKNGYRFTGGQLMLFLKRLG